MEPMELSSNFKTKRQIVTGALKCAFSYTIPIFAGFRFLGLMYGIYMNVSGFCFWYPMLMCMTIFTGSHAIPELLAITLVIALHTWKRQMLISIAGGTIFYMILVQFIF